jgi:NAD(P)-dependent dehydrogenase (short-subunit alcohol dehydrogenase family)
MFEDVKDQVGVVTGGNGRLGQTFAKALAPLNRVYLLDVHPAAASDLPHAGYFQVNIADEAVVNRVFEQIVQDAGRIDFLVNNAALQITRPFERMTVMDFRRTLEVNLSAAYSCIRAVATFSMIPRRRGNIVNIGSIYGLVAADPSLYGESGLNSPDAYAASKGGLIQLTRYLAVHLAPYGIRVNALSPAGVLSNQPEEFLQRYLPKVPLGRMLNREDLVGPLVFLLSEASSYITGHNLVVDGGFTIM